MSMLESDRAKKDAISEGVCSLEHTLSTIYDADIYPSMGTGSVPRIGTAAFLVTNESFDNEICRMIPAPDGYIIGTGNGSIWRMLDLFSPSVLPKGILSLDRDLSVILSGKIIVALAKKFVSAEEVVQLLYGEDPEDNRNIYLIQMAKDIASKETNPIFRNLLLSTINEKKFIDDLCILRHLARVDRPPDIRRRKIIDQLLISHWDTIEELAQAGNIFFAHSDLGNAHTISYIAKQKPDILMRSNIFYTSNVVDDRYRSELNALELLNPARKSWYVYTSQYPDDYELRVGSDPPQLFKLP